MKTIKRFFLFALSALIFGSVQTVNAQVTIGGETEPVAGATLDLSPSGGYVGALKLPNVSLTSLTAIPTGFTESGADGSKLVGAVVYNASGTFSTGMYMWDGAKWQAIFSTGASSSLDNIYPVGSIYMSTSSTNPGSIIGGTWEAWGSGRVPVGVDTSDADFAIGKTGGVKSVELTAAQQAPMYLRTSANGDYVNLGDVVIGNGGGSLGGYAVARNTNNTGVYRMYAGNAYTTDPESVNGAAHTNLQPYITCYMWKRTN